MSKFYRIILTENELNRLYYHLDTAKEHYEEYAYYEYEKDVNDLINTMEPVEED